MGILTENSDEMNRSQEIENGEASSDFYKLKQFMNTSRNYLNVSISGEEKRRDNYNSYHHGRESSTHLASKEFLRCYRSRLQE